MKHNTGLIFFLLIALLFSFPAQGYQTARQLSLAGAGGLLPSDIDGLKYNPATLNLKADLRMGGGAHLGDQRKDVSQEAYYGWVKDSTASFFQTDANREKVSQREIDFKSFPIAAAFVFNDFQRESLSERTLDFKEYTLATSAVIKERFSVGASLTYFDSFQTPTNKESFVSADLGFLFWITKKLVIGASGRNLLVNSEDERIESYLSERGRLSLSYSLNNFFDFYLDGETYLSGPQKNSWDYGGGFESLVRDFIALRAGIYKKDVENSVDYGLGISFVGPKLQLNYGVRVNTDANRTLHTIDLTLPLW